MTADVARFLIKFLIWAPLPLLDTAAAVLLFLLLDYNSYGYCTFILDVVVPTGTGCCFLALINEFEWVAELLVARPKPPEVVPP